MVVDNEVIGEVIVVRIEVCAFQGWLQPFLGYLDSSLEAEEVHLGTATKASKH